MANFAATAVGWFQQVIGDGNSGTLSASYIKTTGGNVVPAPGPSGIGGHVACPAASANGTPAGAPPDGTVGIRFYCGPNDSLTYAIAAAQPGSPPAATITFSGQSGQIGDTNFDEPLTPGMMAYLTAKTGNPRQRFV